jgi:arabinogalactan endo-1,4-beta-galactosidase
MRILALAVLLAPPPPEDGFARGADVSMLLEIEKAGGAFRDGGAAKDALRILRDRGVDLFRLRLFVNPSKEYAKCWGATQDLDAVRALAKRIRPLGAKWLLDFHCSDTWADPAHQDKPAAWKDLDLAALEKTVEEYTAGVLADLRKDGVPPDWVQVGNEISPGFLWPDGKLAGGAEEQASWDRFARLLKAGIRGARRSPEPGRVPRIMVHIDRGGDAGATRGFYGRLRERGVEFDLIGLSYYPWWHGPLENLRENLHAAAKAFGKDVVVVETAYPHRGGWKDRKNMDWPVTPEGQKRFLAEVVRTVREVPEGRGRGVVYWYPEAIPVKGLEVWNGGTTALFDEKGQALPALDAFAPR